MDNIDVEEVYLKLKEWFVSNVDDLLSLSEEDFVALISRYVRGVEERHWTEDEVKEKRESLIERAKREHWSDEQLNKALERLPKVNALKWKKEITDEGVESLTDELKDWFNEIKEKGEFEEEGEEF
jgi:hypothetical protein